MQLAEKLLLRSYHALDYDWTPLSRNPCWLSNVAHRFRCYVKRNRFRSDFISWLTIDKDYCQLLIRLNGGSDKSIVDDFVASGYCKCESGLCATIHWGLSRVPMICSSFIAWRLTVDWRLTVLWKGMAASILLLSNTDERWFEAAVFFSKNSGGTKESSWIFWICLLLLWGIRCPLRY